jgi:hypothetical protein
MSWRELVSVVLTPLCEVFRRRRAALTFPRRSISSSRSAREMKQTYELNADRLTVFRCLGGMVTDCLGRAINNRRASVVVNALPAAWGSIQSIVGTARRSASSVSQVSLVFAKREIYAEIRQSAICSHAFSLCSVFLQRGSSAILIGRRDPHS